MPRPSDAQKFLNAIPDGESIGNIKLRSELGWESEKYERVRNDLVDQGSIKLGRGRGGSVQKVTGAVAIVRKSQDGRRVRREREDYANFHTALEQWAKNQDWDLHIVERIADRRAGKKTGVWTIPDLLVVGYKNYEYTPGKVRDVETFELKRGLDITGVFAAASHSAFATKSTLAVRRSDEIDKEDLARFESECQRFQIGLLLFSENSTDPDDWEWLVEPLRKEPDPANVEKFITRLPAHVGKKLRGWVKA